MPVPISQHLTRQQKADVGVLHKKDLSVLVGPVYLSFLHLPFIAQCCRNSCIMLCARKACF